MKWLTFARYDVDQDPLEDTIEGEIEAATEEEAIAAVRAQGFDEWAWDVYVQPA